MPIKNQKLLPSAAAASPKLRVREGHLTKAQLDAVLKAASNVRDRLLIRLAYVYGLRASEAGGVAMESIDLAAGTIYVARLKGSISGTFKLHASLIDDLKTWLKKKPTSQWLFPRAKEPSWPLDKFSVYRIFKRVAKRAGLPVELQHPHVLKHTLATHLLAGGMDIRLVQERLGHADIRNTAIYAEVGNELKEKSERQAASILDGGDE